MSTTHVSTSNNKVLPGDKSGLPWEIWQIILAWLSASDLCHVACVCKTWTELVVSVDSSRWKELYMKCSEWRHPFWPLNVEAEPPSWRLAYRDQYMATKFWRIRQHLEAKQSSCTAIFKKPVPNRNIHVGPGMGHDSLNAALSTANAYDRIIMHPGIYDEQYEVVAKIPFELVGHGELGSVILVVGIQQLASTTRLSNLVLRAPWFTSFIVMINSGYLQIDNCIIENGIICLQSPSTVHIKFCTFRHTTVILQNMNASIIENCEFSQSSSANIIIEGHPKEYKSWTYSFLRDRTHAIYQQNRSLHRKKYGLKASASITSTIHSSFTGKSITTVFSNQHYDAISHDPSYGFDEPGASFLNPSLLGPRYLGSDRDGMVGCGELQSMYQESLPVDQQAAPVKILSSNAKENSHNPSLCDHDSTISPDIKGSYSTQCNAEISPKPSGSPSPLAKIHRQSSLKRNDRRKSVDSRVGFHCITSSGPLQSFNGSPSNEFKGTEHSSEMDTSDLAGSANIREHSGELHSCKRVRHESGNKLESDSLKPLEQCHLAIDSASGVLSIAGVKKADRQKQDSSKTFQVTALGDCPEFSDSRNGELRSKSCNHKGVRSENRPREKESSSLSESNSNEHHGDNINNNSTTSEPQPGPSGQQCQGQSGPDSCKGTKNHHPASQSDPPPHPIRRSQSDEILSDSSSEDDLSTLNELEDSAIEASDGDADAQDDLSSTSSDSSQANSLNYSNSEDSSQANSLNYSNSEDNLSSSEDSVIMLPHLQEMHADQSDLASLDMKAEVESINSECTRPVPVNVSEDTLMSIYVGQVQGCLIHQCRMNHSKGGVVISLQAHAIISECDISNVGYGIRCIQNSRVVILKNKIHHCRTSGIFMRLAASGLVAGNDIHSNNEAGIDIRKSADPLVQYNQIHHGKRSGVVVLGSGRGRIKKNDIYCNAEAGVYVLFGGNPTISENYIYEGRAAGVAINAGGKGCVIDNVIRANKWGGIDIRNGSCPLISGNTITNGVSDGIVVGAGGRGIIENNFISGNAGCGMWLLTARDLYIHGNQICNSGHCGIMLVDMNTFGSDGLVDQNQLMTSLGSRTYPENDEGRLFTEPHSPWAIIQYNNIYHNKDHGALVQINEEVRLLFNAIHGNQKEGIHISQSAPVVVNGNSITNNGRNGVFCSTQEKTHISENGIYGNAQHGVVCNNSCVVEGNDIVGMTLSAILVERKSHVEITANRLGSSSVSAVKGEESSVITATNNKVYDRGGGDFDCVGSLTVADNVVIIHKTSGSKRLSKSDFSKTDFLTDPEPRPHKVPPPSFTIVPSHYTQLVPKVPSRNICSQGSKLCSIL